MASLKELKAQELKQGSVYILKMDSAKIALFEGWNDELCTFSILRNEMNPMRWSEARFLPEGFSAFAAFDLHGNPPITDWKKILKAKIPLNWFEMFEDARRRQRDWTPYADHFASLKECRASNEPVPEVSMQARTGSPPAPLPKSYSYAPVEKEEIVDTEAPLVTQNA